METSLFTPLGRALSGAPGGPAAWAEPGAFAVEATPETSATPAAQPLAEELFCFKAGGLQLAVPSKHVREVIRVGPITPLPRVAPFVLGVCGHRGEILPVVDLLRLLERGSTALGERTRLFVGVSDAFTVAWACDGTLGLRRVQPAELRAPPSGGDVGLAQLTAIVPGNGAAPSLHVLNLPRLTQAARQKAVVR